MALRRIRVRPPQPIQISQIDTTRLTPATLQQQLTQTGSAGDFVRGAMQSKMVNGVSLDKARSERLAKFDAAQNAVNSRVISPYESPLNTRKSDLQTQTKYFQDAINGLQTRYNDLWQQQRNALSQAARWTGVDEARAAQFRQEANSIFSRMGLVNYNIANTRQQQDAVLGGINVDIASLTQSNTKFAADATAAGKTVATSAEMTRFKESLANEQILLDQFDAMTIDQIKAETDRYNQDQQRGTVASARSGPRAKVPLTGRFGIPDAGVGISIPTFS